MVLVGIRMPTRFVSLHVVDSWMAWRSPGYCANSPSPYRVWEPGLIDCSLRMATPNRMNCHGVRTIPANRLRNRFLAARISHSVTLCPRPCRHRPDSLRRHTGPPLPNATPPTARPIDQAGSVRIRRYPTSAANTLRTSISWTTGYRSTATQSTTACPLPPRRSQTGPTSLTALRPPAHRPRLSRMHLQCRQRW